MGRWDKQRLREGSDRKIFEQYSLKKRKGELNTSRELSRLQPIKQTRQLLLWKAQVQDDKGSRIIPSLYVDIYVSWQISVRFTRTCDYYHKSLAGFFQKRT